MNDFSYESVYYTDGKKQKKTKNFRQGFQIWPFSFFKKNHNFSHCQNAQFSLITMLLNDIQGRKFLRINFPMSKYD